MVSNVLKEERFCGEEYHSTPRIFYIVGTLVLILMSFLITLDKWSHHKMKQQFKEAPFLQVTNRDVSLFLWEFPEYMRVHSKIKIGYLSGFHYLHKINLVLETAEDYVEAPPSLLFLYHTWNRLLYEYVPNRQIMMEEFQEFLKCLEEWNAVNWLEANDSYRELLLELKDLKIDDLQKLSQEILPLKVRKAFYGWKNYYKEGFLINDFRITYEEVNRFLKEYPNYKRHFWKNILAKDYPNYLKSFESLEVNQEAFVPEEEIAPFLRVALYNFYHS